MLRPRRSPRSAEGVGGVMFSVSFARFSFIDFQPIRNKSFATVNLTSEASDE